MNLKIYRVVSDFFHRYFSDEEAVILFILFILFFVIIYTFGSTLAPLFTAVILSYLLSTLVDKLQSFTL